MAAPLRARTILVTLGLGLAVARLALRSRAGADDRAPPPAPFAGPAEDATTSRRCATCHPAIYAEHVQNTHGSAFVDEEARLATRDFRRENCVRCHTPRPVAETGLGMVPIERRHDLEEGNTCMSCHAKAGYDYARFAGGAECKSAFDERVGSVAACATCHRIAGTPEQWEHAREGRLAGRECIDCHMPLVERPVAVGLAPRPVRAHLFPGSRSEEQLHRACAYDARVEGNDVVVTITNVGAGHNLPTAAVQRALESVIVVRDAAGRVVATDRRSFHQPFAEPAGVELPRSTQIPSGASREHRVPIAVATGTIECDLYFKIYHPIEDTHATLSRRLESRWLRVEGIEPSTHVVRAPTGAPPHLPAVLPADAARPDALAKYAHPAPATARVEIPSGDSADDVARLVAILEFPVPGARARARERLVALGARAVPALIEALGHWSDETRDEAVALLVRIGEPAAAPLRAAMSDPRLYVRYHARMALARTPVPSADRPALRDALAAGLTRAEALDRRSAADALARLRDAAAAPALRPLLEDADADVVASAALALAALDDHDAVPAIEAALGRARFIETRRDLAGALASLGSPTGLPVLFEGLDHADDVLRRAAFDVFFRATGAYASYDPDAPRPLRLEAIASLQSALERAGGHGFVRRAPFVAPEDDERAWRAVEALGGGTDTLPGGDDTALLAELVAMGSSAVPALIQGLTFPPGFAVKRALVCEAMGRIGDAQAAPCLVRALRDPDLLVGSWACWALARIGGEEAVPALRRWSRRLATLADSAPGGVAAEPVARLGARALWARVQLGDPLAEAAFTADPPDAEVARSEPPSRAIRWIATTETAPVAAPTSNADAIEKARRLRALDFYEDAVRVVDDADAQFGPNADVRLEKAWNLLMIGEEDVTREAEQAKIDAEIVVARRAFEEARRMDPHVAGQELLEAKLLRYERANREARALLSALVARHPDDAAVHQEFGDFAYGIADWVSAEREYAEVARLKPDDGWAYYLGTIAKEWLEKPMAEIEAGYLAAARRLPEEPMVLARLAAIHATHPERSVPLFERLLADRPAVVAPRVALAGVLLTLPRPDPVRAERLLREALARAPRTRSAHLSLARVLETDGRAKDALLEHLDVLALSDGPDVAEPSAALDRILKARTAADAWPAGLVRRAWDVLVARNPRSAAYAQDAGIWYTQVGGDPAAAVWFLETALAADPTHEGIRGALEAARASAAPK